MEILWDPLLNNFIDINMLNQSLLKKEKKTSFNNKHYPISNRLKIPLESNIFFPQTHTDIELVSAPWISRGQGGMEGANHSDW